MHPFLPYQIETLLLRLSLHAEMRLKTKATLCSMLTQGTVTIIYVKTSVALSSIHFMDSAYEAPG